jgi:hypothetical protein
MEKKGPAGHWQWSWYLIFYLAYSIIKKKFKWNKIQFSKYFN